MSAPRFVNVPDAQHGDLRLEAVVQPLYDTQYQMNPFWFPKKARKELLETPPDVEFFNGGPFHGLSCLDRTNMMTVSQLSWPKRFFACGVRFDFDAPLDKAAVSKLGFRLSVGEKSYVTLPLMQFDKKMLNEENDRAWFETSWASTELVKQEEVELRGYEAPTGSVQIPPVQNFRAVLLTNGVPLGDIEIRCSLTGVLLREIQ